MLRLDKVPHAAKLILVTALAAATLAAVTPAAARPPGPGPGRGGGGPSPGRGGGPSPGPLPPGHSRFFMGGDPYYFHGGRFFRPWRGGFVRVVPPVGLVVTALPPGFEVLVVAGVTYYLLNGIYYQPAPAGYVVVPAPSVPPAVPVAPSGLVAPSQAASGSAAVIAPALNVRSGPGLAYPVLIVVNQGDVLILKGRSGDWLFVRTPGGAQGWVASEFTTEARPPASG